jgi:hypothetical protein
MRKIIIILLLGWLFMSCSLVPNASVSDFQMPKGVTTPMQAWEWVSANIHYVSGASSNYRIQTPRETLETRAGNCEAFSILLAAMLDRLGYESWVVTGNVPEGVHMIVYCQAVSQKLIEPQRFKYYPADFTETSRVSYKTYQMLVDGGWQSY